MVLSLHWHMGKGGAERGDAEATTAALPVPSAAQVMTSLNYKQRRIVGIVLLKTGC